MLRGSSSFSAGDHGGDVLASMESSSWGGEFFTPLPKTEALKQLLPMCIAMMHEAEEEEEQEQ